MHVHGAEEEIFYVLGGSGLLWQDGKTCEVGAGDCIVHLADGAAHTLSAGPDGLDVLAFGMRVPVEVCYLPRTGRAYAGTTVVEALGPLRLHAADAAAGELEIPEPGERFANVVSTSDVETDRDSHGPVQCVVRDLGGAAGSRRTGLNHLTIDAGARNNPFHCHSVEEEIFVVLEGDGALQLKDSDGELSSHPVRAGSVVSRPPRTGVSHAFEAGDGGMTILAYGTRDPSDVCWYPDSQKIYFRGVGVIGRIERLDYWDGEPE